MMPYHLRGRSGKWSNPPHWLDCVLPARRPYLLQRSLVVAGRDLRPRGDAKPPSSGLQRGVGRLQSLTRMRGHANRHAAAVAPRGWQEWGSAPPRRSWWQWAKKAAEREGRRRARLVSPILRPRICRRCHILAANRHKRLCSRVATGPGKASGQRPPRLVACAAAGGANPACGGRAHQGDGTSRRDR